MGDLLEDQRARQGQPERFLNKLIALLAGEARDGSSLENICKGSTYQALAALELLFCPNEHAQALRQNEEPAFVATIR